MPNSTSFQDAVETENAYILHYDGGCTKKKGSGGFIIWVLMGKLLGDSISIMGIHDQPSIKPKLKHSCME